MQSDAEHQQHHTDLGELTRHVDVGDETRGRWPDHDSGEHVTD